MARHYDPFAPVRPKALRRQAQMYVNSAVQPIINQINRTYSARQLAGSAAINNSSDRLAQFLGGQQQATHNIYANAQSNKAAVDEALYNHMMGVSNAQTSGLAHMLAGIPGGGASQVNELRQIGSGAANAGFGVNSAGLTQLIGQGANAENYASQLPGFARAEGLSKLGDFESNLETNRSQDVGKLQAQVPGMVQNELKSLQNLEMQKTVARQSGLLNEEKLNSQNADRAVKNKLSADRINATIRGQDLSHQDRQAQRTAIEAYRSNQLQLSKERLNIESKREKRLANTGKKGGYTALQVQKMKNSALETVKSLKHGVVNPYYNPQADKSSYHKGVPDTQKYALPGGKTRQDAFKYLVNHGYPASIAQRTINLVYGKPPKQPKPTLVNKPRG